jgi:hypothetical protein
MGWPKTQWIQRGKKGVDVMDCHHVPREGRLWKWEMSHRDSDLDGVFGFVWLRIGNSGRLLWTRQWTFGFHKRRTFSCLAERLIASEEPCFMDLLRQNPKPNKIVLMSAIKWPTIKNVSELTLHKVLLGWSSQGGWNWWACSTHGRD